MRRACPPVAEEWGWGPFIALCCFARWRRERESGDAGAGLQADDVGVQIALARLQIPHRACGVRGVCFVGDGVCGRGESEAEE